jgi:hypothetical protein
MGGAPGDDEVDAGPGTDDAGDSGESGAAPLPRIDGSSTSVGEQPSLVGCRVTRQEDLPIAVCALAGSGRADEPCVTSGDCEPGLACVGDSKFARCRPFCCLGNVSCETGTYCAERPLRDDAAAETPLKVPVCVPADACNLAAPEGCADSAQCTCGENTACMVVREDGTTSCVTPGEGTAGEACPCAAGHICSKATDTCLKLCMTTSLTNECGSGRCQSASLPDNWGVCVGDTADPQE